MGLFTLSVLCLLLCNDAMGNPLVKKLTDELLKAIGSEIRAAVADVSKECGMFWMHKTTKLSACQAKAKNSRDECLCAKAYITDLRDKAMQIACGWKDSQLTSWGVKRDALKCD